MMMGTILASLGEGLALTKAAGIEPKLLLEVLDLGVMSCGLLKLKGPKMLAGDYVPNFPLRHAHKDVKLAIGLASSLGLGLPVAAGTDAAMRPAIASGLGDEDFAAMYETQKVPGLATPASGAGPSWPVCLALCLGSVALGFVAARRR